MSARVHHQLAVALACVPLFATVAAFFFAPDRLYELHEAITRLVFAHMHPFALAIAYPLLAMAVLVGSAYLTYLAIVKWVPARCPKCGDRSYRQVGGHWVTIFQLGESITYRCRSCGHMENLGWYESPG